MRWTNLAGEELAGLIETYGADTGPKKSCTFPISLSLLSQVRVSKFDEARFFAFHYEAAAIR